MCEYHGTLQRKKLSLKEDMFKIRRLKNEAKVCMQSI